MKADIKIQDAIELREKFLEYADRAEQHEWVKLAMINIKLDQSIADFDSMSIEEKNSMFRVILGVIGKDFSEYESKS